MLIILFLLLIFLAAIILFFQGVKRINSKKWRRLSLKTIDRRKIKSLENAWK